MRAALAVALVGLLVTSCGDEPAPPVTRAPAPAPKTAPPVDDAERLREYVQSSDPESLDLLIERTSDEATAVRVRALRDLVDRYAESSLVPQVVAARLRDSERVVRTAAAEELLRLGNAGAMALRAGMVDDDLETATSCAAALLQQPVLAKPIAAELVRHLGDPTRRGAAVVLLARLGPDAVPALAGAYDHYSPPVWDQIPRVLQILDHDTAPVIEAMAGALEHEDPGARAIAAVSLRRFIDPETPFPHAAALARRLGDGVLSASAARDTLLACGPDAVDALIEVLVEGSATARKAARDTLLDVCEELPEMRARLRSIADGPDTPRAAKAGAVLALLGDE